MLFTQQGKHIPASQVHRYGLAALIERKIPEEPLYVSGFFHLAARARWITATQKQSGFKAQYDH